MTDTKKLVAAISDLMFTVKIQEAAKRAGMETVFVKTEEAALRAAATQPALIIVDLNDRAFQPLELVSALKSDPNLSGIPVVGFISHVQVEVRREAEQRGCDKVFARSAFSQHLPALLAEYTGSAA
jgi:CheY-like chemotaxis protein